MCNRYEILLKCDLFVCQTLRTVSEGYRMLSAVTTLMSQISGDINTSQRLISFPRYPVEVATNPREDSLRALILFPRYLAVPSPALSLHPLCLLGVAWETRMLVTFQNYDSSKFLQRIKMIGVASFSYGPTAVLFNNKYIIVASPVALNKRRKVYIKFMLLPVYSNHLSLKRTMKLCYLLFSYFHRFTAKWFFKILKYWAAIWWHLGQLRCGAPCVCWSLASQIVRIYAAAECGSVQKTRGMCRHILLQY